MSDPNINYLNRVSEAMIIPNIIQFLELEGTTIAGATLRGGINFKHADGASGDSITFVATDESGNDRTNLQLQFNANLEDLEDVTRVGAAAGHMMVYNDATDKYHSQPITGHATVGTGGVVTLSVDVVGITNLNVATHGSSGHILFNNDGGLNFIEPVLSHLGDVTISSAADANILVYDNSDSRFENVAISGDATISKTGALTISDDKIGTAELKGLTTGVENWVIGPKGDGTLKFLNRVINIADIAGTPAGHTGIMFHDGSTAFFMEGLNIPSLSFGQRGACGGVLIGGEILGSPGVGTSNILGITGTGVGDNKTWAWLNVTEIGTGATGIAGLEEMSLNLPILDGHMFIGHGGDDSFTNRVISGDITINNTGVVAIGAGKVTNAMLANAGGITLATPVGSGLTYSSGGGALMDGAGVTLGGDHTLQVNVDGTGLEISGNALRLKDVGVVAAKLATDSVITAKIQDDAVTTVKIPDDAVTNAKIANDGINIYDGSTTDAVSLGQTITFEGADGISTTVSSNKVSFSGEEATTSNKGIASFNSNMFSTSSGAVSIKTGGIGYTEIEDGSVRSYELADGAVGLSAMNLMSGQHGASGHVMIRFGDGTNQEFGFIPQSSVTASLVLNDITDVTTGTTAGNDVLMVPSGGGAFTAQAFTHEMMADIFPNRILGLGAGSSSAPAQLTANQLIAIINADGSTDWDSDLLPSGIAYLTETSAQTFQGPIRVEGFSSISMISDYGIVTAPSYTTGGWARGFAIAGTNSNGVFVGDQGVLDSLGVLGAYGSGSENMEYMYITARSGENPHATSDISIQKLTGYVGINKRYADYLLDVNGECRISGDTFLCTEENQGVSIGTTDAPDAPLMIKPSGTAPHISMNFDGAGIYDYGFVEFTDGTNRSLILASEDKIAVRTDGYFRVASENEDVVHMSVGADGQIAMGPGHGTTHNAAGCLLHLWSEDPDDGANSWTDGSNHFVTNIGNIKGMLHLDVRGSTDLAGRGGAITFGAQDSDNRASAGIYVATDVGYGSKMAFATTNSYDAGAKTRMIIDGIGNVGIGGNPDAGYKVNCYGNLAAENLWATQMVTCEALTIGQGSNDTIRSKDPATNPGAIYFSGSGLVLRYASGVASGWGPYCEIKDNLILLDGYPDSGLGDVDVRLDNIRYLDLGSSATNYNGQTVGTFKGIKCGKGGNWRAGADVFYVEERVSRSGTTLDVDLEDVIDLGANDIRIDWNGLGLNTTKGWYAGFTYYDNGVHTSDFGANRYSGLFWCNNHDYAHGSRQLRVVDFSNMSNYGIPCMATYNGIYVNGGFGGVGDVNYQKDHDTQNDYMGAVGHFTIRQLQYAHESAGNRWSDELTVKLGRPIEMSNRWFMDTTEANMQQCKFEGIYRRNTTQPKRFRLRSTNHSAKFNKGGYITAQVLR